MEEANSMFVVRLNQDSVILFFCLFVCLFVCFFWGGGEGGVCWGTCIWQIQLPLHLAIFLILDHSRTYRLLPAKICLWNFKEKNILTMFKQQIASTLTRLRCGNLLGPFGFMQSCSLIQCWMWTVLVMLYAHHPHWKSYHQYELFFRDFVCFQHFFFMSKLFTNQSETNIWSLRTVLDKAIPPILNQERKWVMDFYICTP